MDELISVIVPVYNVEQYIDECLKSIVEQTYANLEIIVINDGSSDDSETKCVKWAQKDDRIKILHQENKGLSAARNAGLDICIGEWIVFVDSDDVLPVNSIEILYDMVTLQRGIEIGQGHGGELAQKESEEQDVSVKVLEGRKFLENEHFSTVAYRKIYHKNVWNNRRFREGIIHEDYDIMYKILYETPLIAYTMQTVYWHRIREGSITRRPFFEEKLILLKIDEDKINFFREKQEPFLLELAYKSYYNNLLHLYKQCRKKEIVEKYRRNFKYFIRLKTIGLKTKLKLMVCYFFPGMWEHS